MSWWDEFFSVFSRNNIKFEANRISALQNGSKKQCHLQLAPFPKLAYDNKARSVELEVVQMYARNLLGPVTIWALVCWHNIHTRTHTVISRGKWDVGSRVVAYVRRLDTHRQPRTPTPQITRVHILPIHLVVSANFLAPGAKIHFFSLSFSPFDVNK